MMDTIYYVLDVLLPFEWADFTFMKNALIAIVLLAPVYALIGTMVVDARLSYFSDALGHSALTGIAIGVVLGLHNPAATTVMFGVLFAMGINQVRRRGTASSDTIISVFSSTAMALALALLSHGGNFAGYSSYLIGDILSVSPSQLLTLLVVIAVILIIWFFIFNRLLLISINRSLASSRNIKVLLCENIFLVMVAVLVTLSINQIGVLLINSMLILPAAIARNVSKSVRAYHLSAAGVGLVCGVTGLIAAFYFNTSVGAAVVLLLAVCYIISLVFSRK